MRISCCVVLVFVLNIGVIFAQRDEYVVTHEEVAKELVHRMDVEVPEDAGEEDYFIVLKQRGVAPIGDRWQKGAPIKPADLRSILVKAGRLQNEVAGSKDEVYVLKERGIIVPDGDVTPSVLKRILSEAKMLLKRPVLSGPSIPYPKKGVSVIERKPERRLEVLEEEPVVTQTLPPSPTPTPSPTQPPTTPPPTPTETPTPTPTKTLSPY